MADTDRCAQCGRQMHNQASMKMMDGRKFCSDNCAQEYQKQHQH